jgi:NAD(P)-dependent dehydrogenase (short-subunit alcohol dehydrogenase family)
MRRVVVITGAASGMGLSTAQRLARKGYRVALLDLNAEAAETEATALRGEGHDAIAVKCDVGDREAIYAAMDEVRAAYGPIEIIVTSAGIDAFKDFLEITPEEFDRIVRVNLAGTWHCLQAVVPDMIAAGWGRIVTISSSSAQSGAKRMSHYVASKGGVIGLTRALALDLGRHGITVNSVPPGVIITPMAKAAEARGDLGGGSVSMEEIGKRAPVGRGGTGEDIAAGVEFLVSEDAGYFTGQTLNVNGGWFIG